jgi:hypothetical protein
MMGCGVNAAAQQSAVTEAKLRIMTEIAWRLAQTRLPLMRSEEDETRNAVRLGATFEIKVNI